MPEEFVLDMTPEEFDKTSSKFAAVGTHLSEISEPPEWDTPGVSIAFKFRIIEEGEDEGKENKISCGVKKEAAFKLNEMLTSLGVARSTTEDGKVKFNPLDCVGKKFLSVWTEAIDTRTPEEGGKGSKYSKPTSTLPVGGKPEKLT
jgi:hypothetical protein